MKKISFFLLLFSILITVNAQDGKLRGFVYDDLIGDPITNASIKVTKGNQSTETDLDGAFNLNLPAGTYSLQFSAKGYIAVTISDVEIKTDDVTVLDDIFLEEDIYADNNANNNQVNLDAVVISATAENNSEVALQRYKKKSAVILDGISAARLKITGDSDAVQAAKRITGVTIEDGKYVYVRGLGDRYSKTILNGLDIPGLDPDRNTLQMDIFPTSLLNNILVNKTFSAELPADFSGGLVNIETKSFPTKQFFDVSFGFGFNPQANLTNDYLSYEGGQFDFLGFDDGTRDLPSLASANPGNVPNPFSGNFSDQQVTDFVSSFDSNLAARNQTSLLNSSFSLSFGDQINMENGNDLGYFFSVNLKNDYIFYDEVTRSDYQFNGSQDENELLVANSLTGARGEFQALMGLMGGLAYKTDKSKFQFNAMHLQSGVSRAANFDILSNDLAVGQSGFTGLSDVLDYSERSITNALIGGEHKLANDWRIDWSLSPTYSIANDPDVRRSAFSLQLGSEDTYRLSPGEAELPIRIWRELNEWSFAGKIDFTKEYKLFNRKSKLKFGGASTYKTREFDTFTFRLQLANLNNQNWASPDPDLILQPENIFPNQPNSVFYDGSENIDPRRNAYDGNSLLFAGYFSNEFQLTDKFKSILGVRVENFTLNHTGGVENGQRRFVDQEVLNSTDFFPTANLIYSITKDMNLRGVYARTIARPSFKELSFVEIVDPINNQIFVGGLFQFFNTDGTLEWDGNLRSTYINNFDLRWEYFLGKGQLVSVSGFYKTFQDPIELVRIPRAVSSTEFQPRNVGDGEVYGIEIEVNKNLGFISSGLENLLIATNFTVLESSLDITETELNARRRAARTGQEVEDTREMVGQSPWTLNAGLIYNNKSMGLETGAFYNVRGRTLFLVTNGVYPDVYQVPFHDLSYSVRKSFGTEKNLVVDFRVSNILADDRDKEFDAFNAENQLFESLNPNRTFSLGVSYSF